VVAAHRDGSGAAGKCMPARRGRQAGASTMVKPILPLGLVGAIALVEQGSCLALVPDAHRPPSDSFAVRPWGWLRGEVGIFGPR
jgi:hypothetical protein